MMRTKFGLFSGLFTTGQELDFFIANINLKYEI